MGGGDSENVPVVGNGVAAEDLSATTHHSSSRIKYATESERKAARLATMKRTRDRAKAKQAKDKEWGKYSHATHKRGRGKRVGSRLTDESYWEATRKHLLMHSLQFMPQPTQQGSSSSGSKWSSMGH